MHYTGNPTAGLRLGNNGFAVIDIGSNSVRMVIYDITRKIPVQVYNNKSFCALGRDLDRTGLLDRDGIDHAIKTIANYLGVIADFRVSNVRIVGTAPLREAQDAAEFIDAVKRETALDIRVLGGDEEAVYAAMGVLALEPGAEGVVADFGGGSLELARITNGKIKNTVSLPVGAFRIEAMGREAENQLRGSFDALVPQFGRSEMFYSIGGAWRALAQAHLMKYTGQSKGLQGYEILLADIIRFCELIEGASEEEIKQLYGLEGHRAKYAPLSALALRLLMQSLKPRVFITSTAGVRDGLLKEFLSQRSG